MQKTATDFTHWMRARQACMEQILDGVLPASGLAPGRLHDAMRYAVLGGGKRVRPLLCFAAGEAATADESSMAAAAAAVELIHAYSLVHDDLPCMDDDVLRRGKPTCHVAFDEATALLVGDSLQSLAFQLLADHELKAPAPVRLQMVQLLAQAAGSRGMAGGQAIDLDSVGRELSVPELEFMHIHKTGALIRAAVLLGAHCGRMSPAHMERLDRYAKYCGLAFQVMDDVLDAESDTQTLGKTAGKDASRNKPTYVSVIGAVRARALAQELKTEALDALTALGDEACRLRELTEFMVARTH